MNEDLQLLRKIIKQNFKKTKKMLETKQNFCILCSNEENITKEHVIPRWAFEKNIDKFFITTLNEAKQKYNSTVVPCCYNCNSNLLKNFENYLKTLLSKETKQFSFTEQREIIFWLEYIDYKFQFLDLHRKFIKNFKNNQVIPYLRQIPLSLLYSNMPEEPEEVYELLKNSLKKLYRKKSIISLNSLVIFKSKNKDFYFFHSFKNFIYIELPQCEIALFYFFNKTFFEPQEAYEECIKILEKHYGK